MRQCWEGIGSSTRAPVITRRQYGFIGPLEVEVEGAGGGRRGRGVWTKEEKEGGAEGKPAMLPSHFCASIRTFCASSSIGGLLWPTTRALRAVRSRCSSSDSLCTSALSLSIAASAAAFPRSASSHACCRAESFSPSTARMVGTNSGRTSRLEEDALHCGQRFFAYTPHHTTPRAHIESHHTRAVYTYTIATRRQDVHRGTGVILKEETRGVYNFTEITAQTKQLCI